MVYENLPPYPELLLDKKWRLTNLYRITNKNGEEIDFALNWAQEELYDKFWYQMLVLKARQLGVTTFFVISFLDDCFWLDNISAGVIADKRESSEEIFKKKAKFAYDRMPEWTRLFNSATNDRVGELTFRNGSSYRVSTGFRSGTYQRLLVSEFGKICSKSPDTAKEIVTGSLNTVSRDQIIVIESTAEGRDGYFYDFSNEAENLAIQNKKLSAMQMRFFFFPWWREKSYAESDENVVVTKETNQYLDNLEKEVNMEISEDQRRWYELKSKSMQDSMKQEYPSTPKEAFEVSNEGLYYGTIIAKIRAEGRILRIAYQHISLVHTAWDIGYDDFTSIWCFQLAPHGEIQVINYYEGCNEGAKHYVDWLTAQKYSFGSHILPHDAKNNSAIHGTNYADVVGEILPGNIIVLERTDPLNGIQSVRNILPRCVFDESKCAKGIKHLESYKKDWNERLGTYHNRPLHDEHSHGADAFRYLAMGLDLVGGSRLTPDKISEMRKKHGYK